jgi:hypothetical protein
MLEGCCCFGIRALRLVPDCHFRNRFHERLFTSHFPPPWSNEKLPQRSRDCEPDSTCAQNAQRPSARPDTRPPLATRTGKAARRLLSELRESLQEQTDTSEVLQVVSSCPGDLQPVFAAMLEKAVRICDATFGNIYRWDVDALQLVATHNTPPAYAEHRKQSPFRAEHNNSVAQMITSKKVVHLLDAAANETYATGAWSML